MMAAPTRAPLWEFVRYFLKLGTLGFGGPIALAQLAPGPLAAQAAMYLGWVRGRALGATPVRDCVRGAVILIGASGVVGLLLKHVL